MACWFDVFGWGEVVVLKYHGGVMCVKCARVRE